MSDCFESYAGEIYNGLTPFAEYVPFKSYQARAFPLHCLPLNVQEMALCASESTQTPPEMAGTLFLVVLAIPYQSRFSVEITPDWREPLCLQCAVVAPPGERKSAVISIATKPVYEYERECRSIDAARIEQNRAERAILEGQLEAAKKAAIKNPELQEEVLNLAEKLACFETVHERRWLVDDTTPEKLVEIMEKESGSITVCSSEGGVFDAMRGRYDKTAYYDVYLKGHAGDPITIDRIGRKSNYIPEPRLSMLLTIQPEVLNGLMNNSAFRGRGVCGRIMYAICNSKVGHREISPPPIPLSVRENYRMFIRRALSEQSKGVLHLSAGADEVRKQYQAVIEKRLGSNWESMADWGGKLVGTMVRIAALMHCAQADGDPTKTEISVSTINAAVEIAEVLGDHAAIAYNLMGSDSRVADAQYILKRINGMNSINRSELYNRCRSHFREASAMDGPISVLIDHGYFRERRQDIGYRGRTQISYEVNPLYFKQ